MDCVADVGCESRFPKVNETFHQKGCKNIHLTRIQPVLGFIYPFINRIIRQKLFII